MTPSSLKKKSISKLKKEADIVFSKWIRKRDGKCVTCSSRENLQCGHFHSRTYNSLRYSEKNCNCQCVGCNVFKKGNMAVYAVYLEKKYGHGILQELNKEKQKLKQFKREELEEIKSKYKLYTS